MSRRRIIDHDEAVDDARRWKAEAERFESQARRLKDQLDRTVMEHHAEMRDLQRTNELVMHWNAGLALELSAARFELDSQRGDA